MSGVPHDVDKEPGSLGRPHAKLQPDPPFLGGRHAEYAFGRQQRWVAQVMARVQIVPIVDFVGAG
jgi:hypothetical protein